VREYWDLHGGVIAAGDLDTIARGQMSNEDAAAAQASRVMFSDTELLTCVLWNDLLFAGRCPPWVRPAADQRAKAFSLYLLCDTDLPFAPDPQRCFPDAAGREMCRRLWHETLESRRLPYVIIRGDWEERERTALAAVEQLLAGD
jgi:nicotinamide riboside kinase